jgi:glycosyltransferase involved in cell wall biosynthesis
MKNVFIWILFLAAVFGGAYQFGKKHNVGNSVTVSFQPTSYPAVNRPFVVIVVGYNNGGFLEKTLQSIYAQNYSNFRVVYIDDASTDGSFELAQQLIYDTDKKVSFHKNDARLGVLANLTNVIRDCLDDEIVAVVGGEDWFAHEWVLSRLNQYYANADLWVTYGQCCEYPKYTLGPKLAPARDKPFGNLRLNTFYAGLFKEIGSDDFFEGEMILSAAVDMAYMIPMLEMAQGHSTFIPEVFYVANGSAKENPEILIRCEKQIQQMASYEPLSKWGGGQ